MIKKSMQKTIFMLIFTFSLLFSGQAFTAAEELVNPNEMTPQVDVIPPSNVIEMHYEEELPRYFSSSVGTFNNVSALMPHIEEALRNFEPTLTFTYTGNINTFQQEFLKARDEMFLQSGNDYIHGTVKSTGFSYKTTDGKNFSFQMNLQYFGTKQEEEYVTQRIKEIAGQLNKPGMSDLDKVVAVNEYVVANTAYSYNSQTTPHNAYALLKEGKAVCQAYALVTYRLLTEMGVEARYVIGFAGESHAWNSVKVDGEWYHLDTTWNDPIYTGGLDLGDSVRYTYFLVTTAQLKLDHEWKEADFPVAKSTKYSYFHDLEMGVRDGDYIYYANKGNFNLYKMNYKTGDKVLLLASSVQYLAIFNDVLYYSDPWNGNYLTAYNINTKARTVIDKKSVDTLSIRNEELHYKSGNQHLKYEIPLTADQQAAREVKLKLADLSDVSTMEELDQVEELYVKLTPEQKELVNNFDRLAYFRQTYTDNVTIAEQFENYLADFTSPASRATMLEVLDKYKKLTLGQQHLITNKSIISTYKEEIAAQDAKIEAIAKLIEKLSTTSKTFIDDYNKIKALYEDLDEEVRQAIPNIAKYEKIADGTEGATDAYSLIEALDGTSIEAIIKARAAYKQTPKDSKKLITNLKKLTALEKTLKKEIAAWEAIEAIDPTSAKFLTQVKKAKTAYNKKGVNKALISNSDTFLNLSAQADVVERINKLKASSTKLIAEVLAAKEAFDKLSDKTYVTNAAKLTENLNKVQPAQVVVAKIEAISGDTAQVVVDVRKAYDALDKQSKKYVSNYKVLTKAEARFKNVLTAIKLINAIDTNSKKFLTQVKAAKTAYNKTGTLKTAVTNGQTFEAILDQATVYEKISKLKPSSSKYIAEALAAKEAFDALKDDVYVTNVDKLTTAIEAIKPAQEVIALIDALKGDSAEAVIEAREAFDALDKASKKYVTNQKALKNLEKKLKAEIKAVRLATT